MFGGGYMKSPYRVIYIVCNDYEKAEEIFFKETGYLFESRVCECCGSDFWVDEVDKVESEDGKTLVLIG
tara:strand:+ start:68 stop:274 length:207 start_codon:yes stop_codon:yes gene_type:complete